MNPNLNTLLTAVVGETAITATSMAPMPTSDDVQNIGQLIIQAIIAIITVWKLVKKPKPNEKN
jgi:hypothetical protein